MNHTYVIYALIGIATVLLLVSVFVMEAKRLDNALKILRQTEAKLARALEDRSKERKAHWDVFASFVTARVTEMVPLDNRMHLSMKMGDADDITIEYDGRKIATVSMDDYGIRFSDHYYSYSEVAAFDQLYLISSGLTKIMNTVKVVSALKIA